VAAYVGEGVVDRYTGIAYERTVTATGRLAALVRDERRRRGWSQRNLAEAAGTNHEAVRRLESAQTDPRLTTVLRLLVALDLVRDDAVLSRIAVGRKI